MSEKVIPDSTLDQVKRLRNGCTKISEERYQQSLKCIVSNLHLATFSMVESVFTPYPPEFVRSIIRVKRRIEIENRYNA